MIKLTHKIALVGKGGSGKTTFLKLLKYNKIIEDYDPTNFLDCETVTLKFEANTEIIITFWEFSGHDEFFEKHKEIIKGNQPFSYFFFINSHDNESINFIKYYYNFINSKTLSENNIYFFLFCKNPSLNLNEISPDYVKKFSKSVGGFYFDIEFTNKTIWNDLMNQFWSILKLQINNL